MNRDILNVIISKLDIRAMRNMREVSALVHYIILQNNMYKNKSAIINSDYELYEKMELAIRNQYRDLIEFFIMKGFKNWNIGMLYASEGGHQDLVEFFIESGANNWKKCMYGASEGGHQNLVEFFFTKDRYNLNKCMYYASRGGHMNLIEYFIDKCALLNCALQGDVIDWNKGMCGAAEGGHVNLIEFFIDKCASMNCASMNCASMNCASLNCASLNCASMNCVNNCDHLIGSAAYRGHKNVVEFCIEKGIGDLRQAIVMASINDHTDLVEFIQKKIDENNH